MSPPESGSAAVMAAVASALVAAAVLQGLLASGLAYRVLDRPNERSMHARPTPRIGGIGVLCGLAAGIALLGGALPPFAWAALAIVAAVSAVDDLRGIGAGLRLALHLAAAALIGTATFAGHGLFAVAIATLTLAWMVNLYNFMDGSDALAGSMGVTGFGALAIAAGLRGDPELSVCAGAIAGACAGFLAFNLPPARLFMGDLGSTSLGLLAGTIGALGVARGLWSPWLPAMLFMPFMFDATATLLDRARRGARVWEAHREHAYQKLNLSGLGHGRTASAYGVLMLVNAFAALLGQRLGLEGPAFAVSIMLHATLWLAVQRAWRRRSQAADARH